ncbi:MAG: XrtA/PEP-CTERM system-associated ATPase [Burkholderiales bacterium]
MYEDFYGLLSKPFQLNPDPSFYFASKQHRRAKDYLDYGILRNEGFIVVTGEIGAGKTTIVRGLLDSLESTQVVAAQLVSTQLEADDTLRMIGAAFGVRTKDVSKADLLMSLEVFLVSQAGQGKRCLLVVDEAQNLSPTALEELRMLSNFQFGSQALLQSFLVGQPEFRNMLQGRNMQQLRQRVIAACHIGPLDQQETRQYVEHRLKCAGSTGKPTFDDAAFEGIYRLSRGIPRRINGVCDRLLLLGFLNDRQHFTAAEVREVEAGMQEESFDDQPSDEVAATSNDAIERPRYASTPAALAEARALAERAAYRAEADGERLLQLEERLLRMESTNETILHTLQRLVGNSAEHATARKLQT